MSQDKKKALAPAIKAVLKKHGMKGSIAVRHHSTLVVNIKSGSIDFAANLNSDKFMDAEGAAARTSWNINPYWIADHWTGAAQAFLVDLKDAMMDGNHDRSDIQSDYFDVGWYIDINVGGWNTPYQISDRCSVSARA